MQLTDQQRAALDLNRHVIVTAGAGSGKTTVLVERYVGTLLSPNCRHISQILAITFTEKAAMEMKLRVLQRLEALYRDRPELQQKILQQYRDWPEARISTIHAFCLDVLRTHALAAGMNPDFELVDELRLRSLLDRVFWNHFSRSETEDDPAAASIRAVLRRFSVSQLKRLFLQTHGRRLQIEKLLQEWARMSETQIRERWKELQRQHLQQILAHLDHGAALLPLLEKILSHPRPDSGKTIQCLWDAASRLKDAVNQQTPEEIQSALQELIDQIFTADRQRPRKDTSKQVNKLGTEGEEAFRQLVQVLQPVAQRWFFPLQSMDSEEQQLAGLVQGISRLFSRLLQEVDAEKKRLSLLDFDDLLLKTRDLLTASPAICQQLRRQFRWILVDEFQDTDPVQTEIILQISGIEDPREKEPSNLFLVGDPKQSIYGFRNAEVGIFQQQVESLPQKNDPEIAVHLPQIHQESGPEISPESNGRLTLKHSFRSTPRLIEFFNQIFSVLLSGSEPEGVSFAPLEAVRPPHLPTRVEWHQIECPEDYPSAQATQLCARQVARVIYQSLAEKLPVEDPSQPEGKRALQAGDIAILLPDRRQLNVLETVLQESRIPYQVYQGVGFFQTREVQDAYYLLKAVVEPENDFALIAALRTPYLGISDATLVLLSTCQARGYLQRIQQLLSLMEGKISVEQCFRPEMASRICTPGELPVQREELENLRWFVRSLPRWQHLAAHGGISLLLEELFQQANVRLLHRVESDGEQVLANLHKLVDFATQFEQRRSARIVDFLQVLERQIVTQQKEGQAPVFVPERNRVNVMTIHAAKGLEFPVVILPFLDASFPDRPHFYQDKEQGLLFADPFLEDWKKTFIGAWFRHRHTLRQEAEKKRLLYVATTRARDHLFLISATGYRNQRSKSFASMLEEALDKLTGTTEKAVIQKRQIQAEALEQESVPVLEEEHPTRAETMPGEPSAGEISRWLEKARPLPPEWHALEISTTQLMIFQEDPARYRSYFLLREGQLVPPQLADEYTEEVGGIPYGILVHQALEGFHLREAGEDPLMVRKLLARWPLPAAEARDWESKLISLLETFRNCPLGRSLQEAAEQYSELRLVRQMQHGRLVGVLDRLYRNKQGQWVVLDFKTNRLAGKSVQSLIAKYELQLQIYALLLEGFVPEQEEFPVELFFTENLSLHRRTFTSEELKEVARDVDTLIDRLKNWMAEQFWNTH